MGSRARALSWDNLAGLEPVTPAHEKGSERCRRCLGPVAVYRWPLQISPTSSCSPPTSPSSGFPLYSQLGPHSPTLIGLSLICVNSSFLGSRLCLILFGFLSRVLGQSSKKIQAIKNMDPPLQIVPFFLLGTPSTHPITLS